MRVFVSVCVCVHAYTGEGVQWKKKRKRSKGINCFCALLFFIPDFEREMEDVNESSILYVKIESSPGDLTYLIYLMTLHTLINALCIQRRT